MQQSTLYILQGYDKAWSILQNLCVLAKQPPDPEPILPDETKANGIWSIKEIYTTLEHTLQGSAPVWPGPGPRSSTASDNKISLSNLIRAFNMIANGNWTGPAPMEPNLNRPVSFRDRLAAAAL